MATENIESMADTVNIDGDISYRLVGPSLVFPDITINAGSLREAIRIAQGDLVRETIGYKEPVISLATFDVSFSVFRIMTDVDADETDAHFMLEVAVSPIKDENWHGYEADWWDKKYGDSTKPVTNSFIVYGDDTNLEDYIVFTK
jgi:hypothetical protein